MKYIVTFKATGSGACAPDQLRRENATIVGEQQQKTYDDRYDATWDHRAYYAVATFELEKRTDIKRWTPDVQRWASFGFTISDVQVRKA